MTLFDLRDLEFLIALARQRHFAKAAEDCGVSQPAFSMRIRALEDRLGTSIVKRGNRFQGLTAEGEAIVRHGRKVLDDVRRLEEEMLSARGEVAGTLTLVAVPTAAAYAARLAMRLHRRHPGVLVRIDTATSLAIQQRLEDGVIDAGITYVDSVAGGLFGVEHLYDERYVCLMPSTLAPRRKGEISWSEVAELPLALLEPGMQNRSIIDGAFAAQGLRPRVVSETGALTTALVMAREGMAATILPDVLVSALGPVKGAVTLPIVDPVLHKPMGLLRAGRGRDLPTVTALFEAVHEQ